MCAMKTSDNVQQLRFQILDAIEKATKDSVVKQVETTVKEHIVSDVYNVYSPSEYDRRGVLKNADMVNGIWAEPDGTVILRQYSSAEPNESLNGSVYTGPSGAFAQWINDGDVPNIFNSYSGYSWAHARPFYDNAAADLHATGAAVAALKQGLAKQGIKTT